MHVEAKQIPDGVKKGFDEMPALLKIFRSTGRDNKKGRLFKEGASPKRHYLHKSTCQTSVVSHALFVKGNESELGDHDASESRQIADALKVSSYLQSK